MPVFNEAFAIEDVVKDFYEKVTQKIPDTKFIIAEDGSSDGTKEILKELNKKIPFILISGRQRKGYTQAFKDALHIADTELIFFSDSDGQHDPVDAFKLLKEIKNADVVSGYKQIRHDSFHRIILSKAYNYLIYLLFGLKIKDINSGFKIIKKEVIGTVLDDVTEFKYCVMSEFIIKAYLAGYKIKEVAITHYPRKYGTTAIFTLGKLTRIIFDLIVKLLKLKLRSLRKQANRK